MNKSDFIKQYEISNAYPIDPSRKAMPAEAFTSAICEFLDNRFSGAIKARAEIISAQPILISADYAAYFFKMLLTYIYGRTFLNAEIASDENGLNIIISADEELPLVESEQRELIRLARNAGFEIKPESSSIKLTTRFSTAALHRVYAVSIHDGKRIMLGKLVEIFYHGELLSADPPPKQEMKIVKKK